MSKFLITGGSGFIGTHIVQSLLSSGEDVLNLDSKKPKVASHNKYWKNVDICNAIELDNAVKAFSPEFVIHLAARTDLNGKLIDDYKANIQGVTNLLDTLDRLPSLLQVIFASSMYVCEPGYVPLDFEDYAPHTVYGESKVLTEKIIKERNPKYVWSIIRPTSIWGPYFGEPYDLFFKIVLSKRYFHMGAKACKKTYGYIDNFVAQTLTLLRSESSKVHKSVFYLGDYEPYDISEWADEIAQNQKIRIPKIPFFVFKLAGLVGDSLKLVGIKFPMTSFRLKNMTTDNIHDLSPIKVLMPNLPVTRQAGTMKTVEWIQGNTANVNKN
ncbi:MAG TPA: NAD(P)-dependent oxidoreductase [Dyadobacter sp.]|jgi:nucleoside-diphosphate-sugar epimerase|nr:NAD(P)-dependent oxidoreductase [Dyadobacter sp.]